jgi:hypothetical protein
MNRPYSNNNKMYPEIGVLIRKNSHEVIKLEYLLVSNH